VTAEGDSVVAALQEVRRALEQNEERARQLLAASRALGGRRDEGRKWIDLVASEDGSRTIALLADSTSALNHANGTFRRALVKALYDDGVTLARIGEVLGVTRQRVAHLLAEDDNGARGRSSAQMQSDELGAHPGTDVRRPNL
jgi:hypothetical protein